MRNLRVHIALGAAGLLLLSGCDPTKRVPPGEYLLNRNTVRISERSVDPAELAAIIKQKPNKRIIGLRFHLGMYGLPDPERTARKKARKDARIDAVNEERAATGREPKPYRRTFGQWLRDDVGEAPVLLDPEQTERSTQQMRLYLQKEGWFRAEVTDSVSDHKQRSKLWGGGAGKPYRKPKRDVVYTVTPGPAYHYRTISFSVDDSVMYKEVVKNWPKSLLHPGDRFDADVLDQERTRIADHLRDVGYLFFTREMVVYDADTTPETHKVDVALLLERTSYARKDRALNGTPEGTPYYIRDVAVVTARPVIGGAPLITDTVRRDGFTMLTDRSQLYKPQALLHAIFLRPEERFRQSNADRTYRRLTGLQVFDRVDITYDTTGTRTRGIADARIDLLPGRPQSMALEGAGTNRGGALGTSVSLAYRHRNLFRTMTSIQAQFTLGLEAQQSLTGTGSGTEEATTGSVASSGLFNTVDIGPEVTVRFPYFVLPGKRERFSRLSTPRTALTTLYNYQRRPDYTRTLAKMSLGYEWNERPTRTIGIYPLEVNVVRIPELSPDFLQYLQQANDPVLTDSYTDHLIAGIRGQVVSNTQGSAARRNSFFSRIFLEWAGHPMGLPILRMLSDERVDTSGNRFNTVAGVRYAEFVKLDADLRWLHIIHSKSSVAFRAAGGLGVPYGNLGVLPFESSFFVGGANGLRAWRARSIGPGSYRAPLLAFDRIGEVRIEGNAEYRFKLISYLEGALFVDVGNIWSLDEDPKRPGGAISADLFSELAVGTGIGARLNFEFLIVRFDLGLQTKDPSLPKGERWLFQSKDRYLEELSQQGIPANYSAQFNFNLGIGYPF